MYAELENALIGLNGCRDFEFRNWLGETRDSSEGRVGGHNTPFPERVSVSVHHANSNQIQPNDAKENLIVNEKNNGKKREESRKE